MHITTPLCFDALHDAGALGVRLCSAAATQSSPAEPMSPTCYMQASDTRNKLRERIISVYIALKQPQPLLSLSADFSRPVAVVQAKVRGPR
jgi:hypothetical protein